MNVTMRKIGNSEGVILPKEILERLNVKAGDQLEVKETRHAALTLRTNGPTVSSAR